MLRRKSCDTEMFGGKISPKKDLLTQNNPFDVLYQDFTIQLLKQEGRSYLSTLKLPWYLLKSNIQ